MTAAEPRSTRGPRWAAGLWLGLAAAAITPVAATFGALDAAIHRAGNQAVAQALMAVVLVLSVTALALPLWRALARLPIPGGPLPHGLLTTGLAAWIAPAAAPPLALAAVLWWRA